MNRNLPGAAIAARTCGDAIAARICGDAIARTAADEANELAYLETGVGYGRNGCHSKYPLGAITLPGKAGLTLAIRMDEPVVHRIVYNPRLRLFFLALALILRNIWVWIHQTVLADGRGDFLTVRLERLRFKRMLDWIAYEVVALFHDGSAPYTEWSP